MLTRRSPIQRITDSFRTRAWRKAAHALLIAQKIDDGTRQAAQAIARHERQVERIEAAMTEAGQPLPSWSEAQ